MGIASLVALGTNSVNIQSLHINCCDQVNGDTIVSVASLFKNLRRITLIGRKAVRRRISYSCVNADSLMALLKNCPSLTEFDLSRNPTLDDNVLLAFADHSKGRIVSLSVDHCAAITKHALIQLVMYCPNITTLDMTYCMVDDAVLNALGAHCSKLKSLTIDRCFLVTEQAVLSICMMCKELNYLSVATEMDAFEAVRMNLPQRVTFKTEKDYYVL